MADRVLLIGSANPDKRRELEQLLADTGWNVKSLSDFSRVPEPVEDGPSYSYNALLKARYYSDCYGVPCLADDSGLSVDALDGAPGVYSARYAGEECTYADNNRKLLDALEGVSAEKRTARFVCCAAFVDLDDGSHVEEECVEGLIADARRGNGGFGYDPVFIPDGESRTFAEMTTEEKHAVSHRGRAFGKMASYLLGLEE